MLAESKSTRIDELVDEQLATGRYRSREDVLLEALRSLAEREQTLADIERGLDDEAHGRVREVSAAFAELRAKYQIPVKP